MYKHVLIATDGSELATKAVEHGLSLAKAVGAKVTVLTATEPWASVVSGETAIGFPMRDYDKAMSEHAGAVLSTIEKRAKDAGVSCKVLHAKDAFPAESIVEQAQKNGCDLIIMASHGRRGISRFLLGSQANRVVTHSTVPVLIVR